MKVSPLRFIYSHPADVMNTQIEVRQNGATEHAFCKPYCPGKGVEIDGEYQWINVCPQKDDEGYYIKNTPENFHLVALDGDSFDDLMGEIRRGIFAATGDIVEYDNDFETDMNVIIRFRESNKYVRETLTYEELNRRYPTETPITDEEAKVINTMATHCFSGDELLKAFDEFTEFIRFFTKKKRVKELYGITVKHPPDLLKRRDDHLANLQEISAYEIPTSLIKSYRQKLNELKVL